MVRPIWFCAIGAGSRRVLPTISEDPAGRNGFVAASSIWKLRRGDDVIAELVVTGEDFPWLHATVRPGAGFEALRPLFDDEVRLSEDDDDADAWEAAYDRIRQAVGLIAPDGRAVPEFLLHIDGEDAWWRWSDEPFPEDQ